MTMSKTRHRATTALAWTSWLGAFTGTWLVVGDVISGRFGMVVILAIGTGVAASLALSRHKLTEAITEVFVTGMKISMTTHLSNEQRAQALDDYARTLPGEPGTDEEF